MRAIPPYLGDMVMTRADRMLQQVEYDGHGGGLHDATEDAEYEACLDESARWVTWMKGAR